MRPLRPEGQNGRPRPLEALEPKSASFGITVNSGRLFWGPSGLRAKTTFQGVWGHSGSSQWKGIAPAIVSGCAVGYEQANPEATKSKKGFQKNTKSGTNEIKKRVPK